MEIFLWRREFFHAGCRFFQRSTGPERERARVEKRGPESQGAQRVIKLNYLAQRERKVLQRCVRPALNNKGIINSYPISHFYACTKIFYGFGLMATNLCASLFPPRAVTWHRFFCVRAWWNSNQRLMHQSVFWSAFETRFHVRFLASLIIDGPNRAISD